MPTSAQESHITRIDLVGGHPAMDFVNTVDDWYARPMENYLADYRALLQWAARTELVPAATLRRLERLGARKPEAARRAHRRAIAIRETLQRIFSALADTRPALKPDLERLNGWLARALPRRRVLPTAERYEWQWQEQPLLLDRVSWPVLTASADLLCSTDAARLRECPGCGWLFLDRSRNRSRRWCSMRTCGNTAKARRHYRRHKSTVGE